MQVRGEIGRRLDGRYQLKLLQMKQMIRNNSKSDFSRQSPKQFSPIRTSVRQPTIEPYQKLLYEAPLYTSFDDPYNSQVTIPKCQQTRDASLVPKKSYGIGYNQRIGLSHGELPQIRGQSDFSTLVSRDKVSFLKEQTKLLDLKDQEKREKKFIQIQKELQTMQRLEPTKSQQLDNEIPYTYAKIRVKSRNLRQHIKDTIQKNDVINLEDL